MNHKNDNNKKHIVSCGAIVYKLGKLSTDTEILLIKQTDSTDEWGIPKGKKKPDETFEECAIREVWEETGIRISLEKRLSDVNVSYKTKEKTVVSYFAKQICQASPTHLNPESEVQDAKWFKLNSLPQIQGYQRNLLEEAKKILDTMTSIRG